MRAGVILLQTSPTIHLEAFIGTNLGGTELYVSHGNVAMPCDFDKRACPYHGNDLQVVSVEPILGPERIRPKHLRHSNRPYCGTHISELVSHHKCPVNVKSRRYNLHRFNFGERLALILLLLLSGCGPDAKVITSNCDAEVGSQGDEVVKDCVSRNVKAHGLAGLVSKLRSQ
jgi:hypothetical protein